MLDGWAGRGEVVGGDDEQGPTPKGKGPSGSPAWDNYLILSIYLYTLNSYFCIRKTNKANSRAIPNPWRSSLHESLSPRPILCIMIGPE